MTDLRQEAAIQRMSIRGPDECVMAQEGQQNAGGQQRRTTDGVVYYDPAPLTDYPRMLYRKTDKEQTQEWADAIDGLKDPPMVTNRFDGLLCDTLVAKSATEAEALAADGWDVSPQAAHGIVDGLATATTAKDEEIAELKRRLAEAQPQPAKRGPGRPPKQDENVDLQTA